MYDFLASYAIPAVSVPRSDRGVTRSKCSQPACRESPQGVFRLPPTEQRQLIAMQYSWLKLALLK